MINNRRVLRIGLTLLACLSGACANASGMLHVGDKAPALKVDRWIKGVPVPSFEKGQIYVLEFWATWCGPCRVAMPHLTELAKKYAGKATFIGVDVWENEHPIPAGEDLKKHVDGFVERVGDDMGYNVCADTEGAFMGTNWLKAAAQDGIPSTFVIDRDGKIAWIGHPLYLEQPLSQIIDGTFDEKAFAAGFTVKQEKGREQSIAYAKMMKPIEDAMKAKDYSQVVKECDKAISEHPQMKFAIAIPKFQALMKEGPEVAYTEALKYQNDADEGYAPAILFVTTDGLDKKYYEFCLAAFTFQYKAHPEFKGRLNEIARSYFQLGDAAKAVEYDKQYVDYARQAGVGNVILKDLEGELRKYEDAAQKQGG